MVSSPVADLLNESNTTESSQEETFEEENTIENEEGKVLEIHRFIDDGVKMVSVNGYKLPLGTLLDMVGVEEREMLHDGDYAVSYEDGSCHMAIFLVLIISMVSSLTCFFFAFMETYCPKSL